MGCSFNSPFKFDTSLLTSVDYSTIGKFLILVSGGFNYSLAVETNYLTIFNLKSTCERWTNLVSSSLVGSICRRTAMLQ